MLSAIAAITGQTLPEVDAAFHESKARHPDRTRVDADAAAKVIDRIKTRVGLAPAIDIAQARSLRQALASLVGDTSVTITHSDLAAWDDLLRHTPEHVPTLYRAPVDMPPLPAHQAEMWKTLMAFEGMDQPWVLVGGQMTALHCLENGVPLTRTTDDGDIVVGVWTRRDALRHTGHFLRDRGFREEATADGYGYRFSLGEGRNSTHFDVLLPEGLERQQNPPTAPSGRPGLNAPGGNQALTRAERLPIRVEGQSGYVRRPTLLGSLVAKSHAYVVDSRDKGRHAQDIVALAEIGLRAPRDLLSQSRHADRKPVRRFLRNKTPTHPELRGASDPQAVLALLRRLAEPGH